MLEKAHNLVQTVALLVLTFACEIPGTCKADNDCPAGAFCYSGEKAKVGDRGICVYKEPVIHSFSPPEAAHGAILRIQGEGFSPNSSENSVTLNGVPAKVLFGNSSEINIQVPKNMHCSGLIEVRSGGRSVTSSSSFLYLPTAIVSTFAGSTHGWVEGIGTAAQFRFPNTLVLDANGDLYVTDSSNNCVRKILHTSGQVSTFAGGGPAGFRDGVGLDARFYDPAGLAIDSRGNLYVADYGSHRIRKVSPKGAVELFAGNGERDFLDANGANARFHLPAGIAIDADNNLYVTDSLNHRIRKITQAGEVSTFAGSGEVGAGKGGHADGPGNTARFNTPDGITIDAEGNLYVTDTENNCIRKVLPNGTVHTLAGSGEKGFLDGPGNVARFDYPQGMALDSRNGYLYVADYHNHRIRMVTPGGEVRTIAGGGITGYSLQNPPPAPYADGTGENARFYNPLGIVLDASGNLYVGDSLNYRVRKIVLE